MRDEKSGKESKQVNFRIDPDSAEAFRLFCTTHGMNQAQGFDHLIQSKMPYNQLIADFISLYKHCAKLRFYAMLKPIFRIYVLILTCFS